MCVLDVVSGMYVFVVYFPRVTKPLSASTLLGCSSLSCVVSGQPLRCLPILPGSVHTCPLQAMAWLGSALSACYVPVHPPGSLSMDMDSTIVSTALARNLFRRVPFEAKPVLIAVEEAAKLASAGRGGGTCARRSGKRKHVPGRGEGLGGDAAVASLLKVARAAMQSPLLPLPVPVPPSPSRLKKEEGESGGEAPGAGTLPVDDGEEPNKSPARGGTEADAPTASVTARLLLDAFVQSPADVRRSLRQKMHQR